MMHDNLLFFILRIEIFLYVLIEALIVANEKLQSLERLFDSNSFRLRRGGGIIPTDLLQHNKEVIEHILNDYGNILTGTPSDTLKGKG